MDPQHFLEVAVQNLPGGLILVDLKGKVRAINQAGQHLLGLDEAIEPGTDCEKALRDHPKLAKILRATCDSLNPVNRQEITTTRPDGEKIVIGYGTLILKNSAGTAVGVGMNFQDITRLIPLMDSHRFLDIALRNLPGGLIFIDLQGKVRGVNEKAEKILGLKDSIEPGTECYNALADHPKVVKVLLATSQSQTAVNREELTTHRDGEKVTLGYGTLVLRDPKGQAIGIGMTFQDITRFIPLPLQAQFIRMVDRFFTPFASILVLAAAWMGFAETWTKHVSIALLLSLFIFNEVSVAMARKHNEWAKKIGYTRIITNFLANVALVYMLGTFWGPMWLLFVLTPVATALYADWKNTAITAAISAGALLGIYYSRGLEGAIGWGQAGLHAAFIVFISMFVNSIARMIMQVRSGTHSSQKKPTIEIPIPKSSNSHTTTKLAA
jgi:PAS domain S-box-containing protein